MIRLKRAYEPPSPQDGTRILVERLWPRGLTKQKAAIDLWLKEVAPSPELRQWFSHDPAKWKQFEQRYWKELQEKPDVIASLKRTCRGKDVTFIYAARDEAHNGAVALKAYLARAPRPRSAPPAKGAKG